MKLSKKQSLEETYENEPIEESVDEPMEEPIDADDDLDDSYEDELDDFYDEGQPPMEKRADLLKSLTNFDPYLKDTFNNWLGLTWDEEKEKFVKNPLIKPTMSLQGAAWCGGYLKTYARPNNIITDISQEEYKHIMMDIIDAIWLNLGTRDDLGIVEDGDLIRVGNEMEHAAALCLMGAGDGKYNKFLGTTISRHENVNPENQLRQSNQQYMARTSPGVLGKMRKMILGR